MSKYKALEEALAYAKQTGGIGLTASVADLGALLADLEVAEKALREVIAVFDSNPSSICDTVWITGNRPETLYDHCQEALAQMAGG